MASTNCGQWPFIKGWVWYRGRWAGAGHGERTDDRGDGVGAGHHTVSIDVPQIQAADGGLTCLSIPF